MRELAANAFLASKDISFVEQTLQAAKRLDLRETGSGANVILLEPFDPVVFERNIERDGLKCVAPSQLAVDLLTGPGREPSQGEELLPRGTYKPAVYCSTRSFSLVLKPSISTVALADWVGFGHRVVVNRHCPAESLSFAGYRFSPEVILLAVRWYLRYGLSYGDVEELLAERGIEVDHVTIFRWVQRFTPLLTVG